MQEVALFSIPGCVSFPHTEVPLHVFEPRYREMVNYCLSNEVMMGVCHTQKTVHQAREKPTLVEKLNSNQSTYKPHTVFSIGHVDLLETLPDGRMHILVDMKERVSLVEEVQTLPFSIVTVERYPDDLRVQSEAEESTLKEKLIKRLQVLFADNKDALNYFSSEEIAQMSAEEFSFKVFSLVRFEPEIMQDVLEMKGAQDRLSFLLEGLNRL